MSTKQKVGEVRVVVRLERLRRERVPDAFGYVLRMRHRERRCTRAIDVRHYSAPNR